MNGNVGGVVTQVLDHHGLVAAKCVDLRLAQRINERLGKKANRIVSTGHACVAMILNGLGFTNRPLYLTPQFFESKPVEALLGPGIEARHLNDDALGDALDTIAEYGPSELFGEVAFEIAVEHDLLKGLMHADTTSFSVEGEYATCDAAVPVATQDGEPKTIKVTHGYSKDHRPDLKQVVLSLAVTGGAGVPLWMMPCDGNASDKTVLPETIARVEAFRREIDCSKSLRWVADSALYTAPNLDKMKHTVWVSRVPETIAEAKALIGRPASDIAWQAQDNGYKIASFDSSYAGITQRWLLVFSEQAYRREADTLEKRLVKQAETLGKVLHQLSNETFACEKDAQAAFDKHIARYPLFVLTSMIVPVEKYAHAGRPKAGEQKIRLGYQVQVEVVRNEIAIAVLLNTKGRFILATNDMDRTTYPDTTLLADYKAQQTVEQGFRFLKNPEFLADTLFLKSPKRIAALMMVMTLCLMVYNLTQFQVREKLQSTAETLPNQLGKSIQTPTLRWLFQIMEGVAFVRILDGDCRVIHEVVSNLDDLRIKIIRLFGKTACEIYRIRVEGGGM